MLTAAQREDRSAAQGRRALTGPQRRRAARKAARLARAPDRDAARDAAAAARAATRAERDAKWRRLLGPGPARRT